MERRIKISEPDALKVGHLFSKLETAYGLRPIIP
jgi:hypothetical protein